MFVRLKKSARTVNPIVQIVENIRVGGKVQQKVIASLGSANSQESMDQLERLAHSLLDKLEAERKRQNSMFPDHDVKNQPRRVKQPDDLVKLSDLEHTETIHDGYKLAVDQLLELAGFESLIGIAKGRRKFDVGEILRLFLAQRLFSPASKLRTYERQNDLGFDGIELKHIYRAMDAIGKHSDAFQKQAFLAAHGGLFKDPVECFFFDVTTLYFESVVQDDIRDFGFSKDQKHHSTQIVLCLVVNREGLPLAFETFKGNTAETNTLVPVMNAIRERFNVQNVTVVCDRGMASAGNLESLRSAKLQYVVACKLKHLSSTLKLNDLSTFEELSGDDDDTVMCRALDHPKYTDTHLIVTHSKRRAAKDAKDRERLLDKIRSKMTSSSKGQPIKKLISNNGYKQFVKIKGAGVLELNEEAIAAAASWDGFHGIAVSKDRGNLSVSEALFQYRGLWRVEETFRIAKSTLKTRPIFHWSPDRIRSHVLICFLTLFIERQMELLLRRRNTALTPDRIRRALGQIHHIKFRDKQRDQFGRMESTLTPDAKTICATLGISTRRQTSFDK
jgi:hypothetical protein